MERKQVFTAAVSSYSWFLLLHHGGTELPLQGITPRQMTPKKRGTFSKSPRKVNMIIRESDAKSFSTTCFLPKGCQSTPTGGSRSLDTQQFHSLDRFLW